MGQMRLSQQDRQLAQSSQKPIQQQDPQRAKRPWRSISQDPQRGQRGCGRHFSRSAALFQQGQKGSSRQASGQQTGRGGQGGGHGGGGQGGLGGGQDGRAQGQGRSRGKRLGIVGFLLSGPGIVRARIRDIPAGGGRCGPVRRGARR